MASGNRKVQIRKKIRLRSFNNPQAAVALVHRDDVPGEQHQVVTIRKSGASTKPFGNWRNAEKFATSQARRVGAPNVNVTQPQRGGIIGKAGRIRRQKKGTVI